MSEITIPFKNNSERPVDALALILEKGESLTHSLTYNLKSSDASASKKNEKLKGSILNESLNISVYFLGGGQVPVENVFLFAFWEGKQPIQKPSCKTTLWTFAKKLQYEIVYSLTRIRN